MKGAHLHSRLPIEPPAIEDEGDLDQAAPEDDPTPRLSRHERRAITNDEPLRNRMS